MSNKERYLLEVKAPVGLTCIYIKLTLSDVDDEGLYAYETFTHRMPESYWKEGYGTPEPPIIHTNESVYFELTKRYGKLGYLCVWVQGDVIMTELVGSLPDGVETSDGFELIPRGESQE